MAWKVIDLDGVLVDTPQGRGRVHDSYVDGYRVIPDDAEDWGWFTPTVTIVLPQPGMQEED